VGSTAGDQRARWRARASLVTGGARRAASVAGRHRFFQETFPVRVG